MLSQLGTSLFQAVGALSPTSMATTAHLSTEQLEPTVWGVLLTFFFDLLSFAAPPPLGALLVPVNYVSTVADPVVAAGKVLFWILLIAIACLALEIWQRRCLACAGCR